MSPFESILVATDHSPPSRHAVRRAALLAARHGAALRLLQVPDLAGPPALRRLFPPPLDSRPPETAHARAELRRLAREIALRHGIAVTFDLATGDARQALLGACEGADLLVLGSSCPAGLLRAVRQPVLVVKRPADEPYARVMVPVDLTPCSDTALEAAAGLADRAAIDIFHARAWHAEARLRLAGVDDTVWLANRMLAERQTMARMLALAASAGAAAMGRVRISVGRGDPSTSILEHASASKAEIIVAGKQGRSPVADFLLGSVTQRLVARSPCDLLVIPPRRT